MSTDRTQRTQMAPKQASSLKLKRRPLEVGANFIARTAHSANQFLCELRKETSRAMPLLWSPGDLRDIGIIEVYPAATKFAFRDASPASVLGLDDASARCLNRHVEDALWCIVAGLHFICGECEPPTDTDKSIYEGWIWFRRV